MASEERGQTNLSGDGDVEKMNETNVHIPNDLDTVNQTEPAEVIPQLFFGHVLI